MGIIALYTCVDCGEQHEHDFSKDCAERIDCAVCNEVAIYTRTLRMVSTS